LTDKPTFYFVSSELPVFLVFNHILDIHEFFRVILSVCEGSYKTTALYQISLFGLDDKTQSII